MNLTGWKRSKRLTLLTAACLGWLCGAEIWESRMAEESYPAPRFPSYLKPPASVEDALPFARSLARNRSGIQGAGLGVVSSGETVLLVGTAESDDLILEALRRALEERGVKVHLKRDYELVGVNRQAAAEIRRIRRNYTSEKGYMEAAGWISGFADPDNSSRKWLRERRPDLEQLLFPPSRELSPEQEAVREKLARSNVGAKIREYLSQHPEIRGVFWGKGGTTGLRKALYPLQDKYLGTLTADNRWNLMSRIPYYPADVWQLSEEKVIEPLAHVDRIAVTDPEGTDIGAEVSPVQAERWARGAYQRGHLYMLANQATTRFGYSVVDYPALQDEWLPREPMVLPEGVIAATKGHTGFYPRMKVHFKNGYIVKVEGGGIYGEVFREFLQYPRINELTFPYHNHPGFWYLYETAFGTHPKYFRDPEAMESGSLSPERLRSGVIHWGLGLEMRHDPEAPRDSVEWQKFITQHHMPRGHGFHMHTYFTTYRIRIRGAGQWVTLLEKGRMKSLDDPEVRALASRYGDPDRLLAEDWIPEVPGINVPGDYQRDYAADPWQVAKEVIDRVAAGTYRYFYPPSE